VGGGRPAMKNAAPCKSWEISENKTMKKYFKKIVTWDGRC
jgi:hypothetical protein